jgi:3-deoxy-D-manno-octulosonic-acid transferase
MDTKKNAQQFLDLIHPDMVFFIKYEYWPNYLNELKTHKTYLISGILRKPSFFKWYGGFTEKAMLYLLFLYKMKVQKIYFIP